MSLLPDTATRSAEGHLCLGGCDTVDLVHQYGTPLYVYDQATLRNAAQHYRTALEKHYSPFTIAYAAKAYLCTALARLWAEEGLGLDVVGPGELETALRAGFPPQRIHLHGNNKPPALLARAIEAGVGCIVIDGWHDFENLANVMRTHTFARQTPNVKRQTSNVKCQTSVGAGLRTRPRTRPTPVWLRLSPGIDAHTHAYRKTGLVDSKFGFPIATGDAARAVARALADPNLELRGLHAHVGSQILEPGPLVACAEVLIDFAAQMRDRHGWVPEELSPGGGWGVAYTPEQPDLPPETYIAPMCAAIVACCQAHGLPLPHLVVEPGRSLVARAGVALYTVGGRKEIAGGGRAQSLAPTTANRRGGTPCPPNGAPPRRIYVALDGGLADNPRPALYGAQYTALCADREGEREILRRSERVPRAPQNDRRGRSIILSKAKNLAPTERVTLCGPFCESGDLLARDVTLPALQPGDLVAVPVSGAYHLAMASAYNGFPRPAVVMVADGHSRPIQRRETVDDLLCRDVG